MLDYYPSLLFASSKSVVPLDFDRIEELLPDAQWQLLCDGHVGFDQLMHHRCQSQHTELRSSTADDRWLTMCACRYTKLLYCVCKSVIYASPRWEDSMLLLAVHAISTRICRLILSI